LDIVEEEVLRKYIIDLDDRGMPPRVANVEDMANLLSQSRGGAPVGKHWVRRFIDRNPDLKIKINRKYDYQRALCENPDIISGWFGLVANTKAKYGIQEDDIYNFDETGFMMGVIGSTLVVTRADRRGKAKSVQPGNREWATAIECINSQGWCLPPFLIVSGQYHLANWSRESGLPLDWVIKPTTNGWTDNETGLDWIKHFEKHTKTRTKGTYRLLVLDGHESHISAEFEVYCKDKNIITLSMPPHSSHLLQPLDIALYSPLKRAYSKEIELFIKASVNHITKQEFFIAFKAAHLAIFKEETIRSGFKAAGLIPHNPDEVISKLDVRLRTPTPISSRPGTASTYNPRTPSNPQQTVRHSTFLKRRISTHQGSSPTPILNAVDQMAKGMQVMANQMTLMREELHTLREANQALAKRRRAKRTRVQLGGALTIEESQALQDEKDKGKRPATDEGENGGPSKRRARGSRRCGNCGNTGHNSRTCGIVIELGSELGSD